MLLAGRVQVGALLAARRCRPHHYLVRKRPNPSSGGGRLASPRPAPCLISRPRSGPPRAPRGSPKTGASRNPPPALPLLPSSAVMLLAAPGFTLSTMRESPSPRACGSEAARGDLRKCRSALASAIQSGGGWHGPP
eukprot:352825-Chlamydomonas_euryale.AAC.15